MLIIFSGIMLFVSHEHALMRIVSEQPQGEPKPADILRSEFQNHRPRAQRFVLHLSLGRVLFSEGNLAKAAVHYSEAIGLAGSRAEQVEARRLLSLAYLRQGRLSSARELLKAALDLADEDTQAGVLHALADVRTEMGHLESAIKLYNRAFDKADQGDIDTVALLATDISEAWSAKGNL